MIEDPRYEAARSLASQYSKSTMLNEADTRHRVVDVVLHDVLGWPRNRVACEQYVKPGFADYVLSDSLGRPLLVIEAKKDGESFLLPAAMMAKESVKNHSIATLMTDPVIRSAMTQVQQYAVSIGCEYCCACNGQVWIYFKAYERGKRWDHLTAYVITTLSYYCDSFTEAINTFGYTAVNKDRSLETRIGHVSGSARPMYLAKDSVPSYKRVVDTNYLSGLLRPLANRFFKGIDEYDHELMDHCYVNNRDYQSNFKGMQSIIHDLLSPYFKNFNIHDFFDDKSGGSFGRRIESSVRDRRTSDVIVLCGGKGSGKSTFLRRLLYHSPPQYIRYFSVPILIDLINVTEERTVISKKIWDEVLVRGDKDGVFAKDRPVLLDVFLDEYTRAAKQELYGIEPSSSAYNIKLNELVSGWLADRELCARKLSDYWKKQQKGLIVVIDNTDQLPLQLQDFCFTIAQQLAKDLDCLVIISMREERFYQSKIHGLLDAYQNSGFHITSPPVDIVFKRRVHYLLEVLDDEVRAQDIVPQATTADIQAIRSLFEVLHKEFRYKKSKINILLRACSHGDTRLGLQFFRDFLQSGYTRVREMTENSNWTLQTHQVLRPMMVPRSFFYDEANSFVPNCFKVRYPQHGSHFTMIRVLRRLVTQSLASRHSYVDIDEMRSAMTSTYNMLEDCNACIDVLLKHSAIESDERVDELTPEVQRVRITSYGLFLVNNLIHMFNYIELVAVDLAYYQEAVANEVALLANQDLDLYFSGSKYQRLECRLKRCEIVLAYLHNEEERESEYYSLSGAGDPIMPKLIEKYNKEKERVLKSAKRNYKITE